MRLIHSSEKTDILLDLSALKYTSKEKNVANFEYVCIAYVTLFLKMRLRNNDRYFCIFSAIFYISMAFEGSYLQLKNPPI